MSSGHKPILHKERRVCNACTTDKPLAELKRCARCKNAWYCDEKCQTKDWAQHKPTCSVAAVCDVIAPKLFSGQEKDRRSINTNTARMIADAISRLDSQTLLLLNNLFKASGNKDTAVVHVHFNGSAKEALALTEEKISDSFTSSLLKIYVRSDKSLETEVSKDGLMQFVGQGEIKNLAIGLTTIENVANATTQNTMVDPKMSGAWQRNPNRILITADIGDSKGLMHIVRLNLKPKEAAESAPKATQ